MRLLIFLLLFNSLSIAQQNSTLQKGISSYLNNQPEKAMKYFDKVLKKQPNDAKALLYRGILLADAGKHEEALKDLEISLSMDSMNPMIFHHRSLIRSMQGDIEGAIKEVSRAIKLDPSNSGFYFNRSTFRIKTRDFIGAIEDGERCIAIDPPSLNPFILLNIANSYLELGNYPVAKLYVDNYINIENAMNGYGLRGDIHFKMENYAEAKKDYLKYIEFGEPEVNKGSFYFKMGLAQLKLEDFVGACNSFSEAKKLGFTDEQNNNEVSEKCQ